MLEMAACLRLPDRDSPFIHCKYPLEPFSWRDSIVEFWTTCIELAIENDPKRTKGLVKEWNFLGRKLLAQAKAVGTLSRTDGCVCMDRSFDLVGFGGKIDVHNAGPSASLTYADSVTKKRQSEDAILQLGMRHQSAFRLCKAIPNAIAFVVSQDGDLRLFYSDSEHVYFIEEVEVSTAACPVW